MWICYICCSFLQVMPAQPPVLPRVTSLLTGVLVALGVQEHRPALNLLPLLLSSLRQSRNWPRTSISGKPVSLQPCDPEKLKWSSHRNTWKLKVMLAVQKYSCPWIKTTSSLSSASPFLMLDQGIVQIFYHQKSQSAFYSEYWSGQQCRCLLTAEQQE